MALSDIIMTAAFSFGQAMEGLSSEEVDGEQLSHGQLLVYMADKYQARRAPQSPRELELTMRKNPIAARGLVDW